MKTAKTSSNTEEKFESLATLNSAALFPTIPLEVFHNIVEYLDPVSNICFSLSCKLIKNVLGTSAWRAIVDEDHEQSRSNRETFLKLLSKDLIRQDYCRYCEVIHDCPLLSETSEALFGICSRLVDACEPLGSKTDLFRANIATAWRRYHQGLEHAEQLQTLAYDVEEDLGNGVHHQSGSARIVSGRLIFRIQHLYHFADRANTHFFNGHRRGMQRSRAKMVVCPHIRHINCCAPHTPFRFCMRCRSRHLPSLNGMCGPQEFFAHHTSCPFCSTEIERSTTYAQSPSKEVTVKAVRYIELDGSPLGKNLNWFPTRVCCLCGPKSVKEEWKYGSQKLPDNASSRFSLQPKNLYVRDIHIHKLEGSLWPYYDPRLRLTFNPKLPPRYVKVNPNIIDQITEPLYERTRSGAFNLWDVNGWLKWLKLEVLERELKKNDSPLEQRKLQNFVFHV